VGELLEEIAAALRASLHLALAGETREVLPLGLAMRMAALKT
jgi:hypothetical protein